MFDFKLIPDDQPSWTVTADSRDVAAWERVSKGSMSTLEANLKMNDLYDLAFQAARRQKLWDGNRSDFESAHKLEFGGETPDAQDPTSAAPSVEP